MAKLLVSANAEGEITTWGEEFAGGVEIPQAEIPSDWEIFRTAKYLFDGTALVVRAGWVDPVISEEPEVPTEPEVPADPE
jgi:hypothetical protein